MSNFDLVLPEGHSCNHWENNWWQSVARSKMRPEHAQSVNFSIIGGPTADRMQMSEQLRSAFEFLRNYSNSAYSHNTLMRMLGLADNLERGKDIAPPYILKAEVPFEFDEVTETKKGGLLGLLVQTNENDGKAVGAVGPDYRNIGVGSALVTLHLQALGVPSMWVHRTRTTAIRVLMRCGLVVVGMNGTGALRLSLDCVDDD